VTRLTDTSADVERLMTEVYRRMSPARKWQNLSDDYRLARGLHAAGMRCRHSGISLAAIQADWIATTLGYQCPAPIPEPLVEPSEQEFQPVLRHTLDTLDRLGIGYAIGGSVASSVHGEGRMTRDVDITAEPFPGKEGLFVLSFPPPEYYLSADAVREALRARGTFNILHTTTGYKVDIFVRKDEPFELAAFDRRALYPLPNLPGGPVMVHSPEDIILFKLRWFRMGGGVSEKQWTDIRNVLKTQAGRLDDAYLDLWALDLGVKDLLDKARSEV
jgi:hypothetical protein